MADEIKNSTFDPERLRSLVERIERLEEEKKAIANDIKEVYAEAKAANFDTKAIKKIIQIRKKYEDDPQELEYEEFMLDAYRSALGISQERA